MATDLVLSNSAPLKPSRETHSIPAAYALHHDKSGKVYVGSTGNLYARMSQHRTDLKRGVHRNPNLQAAFDDDPKFSMSYVETESKEQAVEIEQHLLSTHHSSGRLLNVATDAVNPGAGMQLTDEQKEARREAALEHFSDPANRQRHSDLTKQMWQDPSYRESHMGRELSRDIRRRISDTLTRRYKEDPSIVAKQAEGRKRQVVYDGVTYASVTDASRKLGIPISTLHGRIKRPADTVKLNAKPLTYKGVDYPSIAEAARANGLTPDALSARIKRQKTSITEGNRK